MVNHGGCAATLFSSRRLKYFENEKFSFALKIAEIGMRVNFGSKRTILDIKAQFLKLNPFSGKEISEFDDSFSS